MADNPGYDGGKQNDFHDLDMTDRKRDDVTDMEARRRDQSPLWNCRLVVAYPKTCFGVALFLHLASVFALFILLVPGYDIFPADVGEVYIDLRDHESFLHTLAWRHRNDDEYIIKRVATQVERTEQGDGIEIQYKCKDCNVLTKENFALMWEAQETLAASEEYKNDFCHRIPIQNLSNPTSFDYVCSPIISLLSLFDGSFSRENSAYIDPEYDNIAEVLHTAINDVNNSLVQQLISNTLPKKYDITETEAYAETVRGYIVFGMPLANYSNTEDRRKEQERKLEKFIKERYDKIPRKLHKDKVGEMDFYYSNEDLLYEYFDYIIYQDMYYVIGSFLFIFVFVLLQTWSLFVTIFTTGSLLTAFCITNLIYRFMLDFRYFGSIHFLVVFVVLGIGIDDIFLFTNAWKQTGRHNYRTLAHRLSDCYRRTALPMFFTSVTTILSFCVSISSALMTISTLAAFGAIYMFVIYLSVIIYFPTVMVVYHLYFEKFRCFCCCARNDWDNKAKDFEKKPSEPNIIVRFFRGPYHWFVTNKFASIFILLILAAILAEFIYYSTQVEIDIDLLTINPFRTNNNFGKFMDNRNEKFPSDGSDVNVYLIWGLKKQDLSGCHMTDSKCDGHVVYDDRFNLNSAESQNALHDLCTKVRNLGDNKIKDLHIKTDEFGNPDVQCFINDMTDFYTIDEPDRTVCSLLVPSSATYSRYNTDPPNLSLPWNIANVVPIMTNTSLVYSEAQFDRDYENFFEIALSHWMYGGWPTTDFPGICVPGITMMGVPLLLGMPAQFREYDDLLGEKRTANTKTNPAILNTAAGLDFTYHYGTKLQYAAIVVKTTLKSTLRYDKGLPIRDEWDDFMEDELENMPDGLKHGFQATPETDTWHILYKQQALITTAWIGVGVSIAVVLVLIFLGTLNILTAVLATFIIACVVPVVIGFMPQYGSSIGIFETVVITLVVGVSSDYSIHMSLAYSRSLQTTRKARVKDALEDIALSVTSGVLTTLGSCFFMFFAVLSFFPEFAGILFITMIFAWLGAVLFLPCILGLIGPEGNFASLKCACIDDRAKYSEK